MRDFEAEGQLAAEEQDAGAVILDFYASNCIREFFHEAVLLFSKYLLISELR